MPISKTNQLPSARRRAVQFGLSALLATGLLGFSPLAGNSQTPEAAAPPPPPVIVPTPQSTTSLGAPVVLGSQVSLVVSPDTDPAAQALAQKILQARGVQVTISSPAAPGNGSKLRLGSGARADIAPAVGNSVPGKAEGYALLVTDTDVVIGGSDGAGQYYGVQTLKQLLAGEGAQTAVAKLAITDSPSMPIRGAIEGFYGAPWSQQDRLDQLAFYGDVKMNTYIYAPKDDPYHRSQWRDPYPAAKLAELKALVDASTANHVRFTFALSPGESVCFSSQADRNVAIAKMQAMYDAGVRAFSIPLDDISYTKWNCSADQTAYGAPGASNAGKAQVDFLNYLNSNFIKTKPGIYPLQMVPTEYYNVTASAYKAQFKTLQPDIVIMWTGTDVVPPKISNSDAAAAAAVWGRKVFLWDNYPVNDFGQTTGRLLMGAYDKREAGLSTSLQGIVSNPMNQASASKPAVIGVAGFAWNDGAYDAASTWRWALAYLAQGSANQGNPALAAALTTFADLNYAAPTFGNTFWLPQAPALKQLSDAFNAAPQTASLAAIKDYADSMVTGAPLIRNQLADRIFVQDASAWLDAEPLWGRALEKAAAAVEAARAGEQNSATALVQQSQAAVDQARAVKITDKKNTWSEKATPAPKLGDGVLDTLISTLNNIVTKTSNFALNSPEVKVSGVEPGTSFTGPKAVDGDSSTRWASNYADNAWIQVKLTQSARLDSVQINWESACASAYKVQTSPDGVNWTDYPVDKPVCGVQTVAVSASQPVGFIKIQGIKRATSWGYSIFEIAAYGKAA